MQIKVDIDDDKLRGLLCCAFEGGSNYWYMIEKVKYPKGYHEIDYADGGRAQVGENYWHWSQLVPLQDGGALVISSKEDGEINGKKRWTLNRKAIERGLQVMREKYPKHFGDFVGEREDANTGDIFLQCCLFGEAVYG